jgi:hypothetical protein
MKLTARYKKPRKKKVRNIILLLLFSIITCFRKRFICSITSPANFLFPSLAKRGKGRFIYYKYFHILPHTDSASQRLLFQKICYGEVFIYQIPLHPPFPKGDLQQFPEKSYFFGT